MDRQRVNEKNNKVLARRGDQYNGFCICMLIVSCGSLMLQVTLSIELNDSQVDEFESMIPVQLAQPPWNYTLALSKGITVLT